MKKYKSIKTEEKNKGYVLFLLLILIIFLTLGASIIGYTTQRTMQNFKADEHAIKALRIAESGLERMIAELEKNPQNCTKYESTPLREDFSGGHYEVYCNNADHFIMSCGYFMNAKRCVKVSFNQYIPFAIKEELKIAWFQNTRGNSEWDNASIYAKEVDNYTKTLLESANFTFQNLTDPKFPLVAKAPELEKVFFDNVTCDIGNFSTNLNVNEDDIKNNCTTITCIVCGNTLTINEDIELNNSTHLDLQKLVFIANSTINVNREVKLSGVENFDITFLARGDINIHKQLVRSTNETDLSNILVYAGGDINIPSNSNIIYFTGRTDRGNILILSKGKISDNSNKFLYITGDKSTNILIWADKGINSQNSQSSFFYVEGGNFSTQRKFAILVGNGSAIFNKWYFEGEYNRGGLTAEEIKDLCNDSTLNEFVREVYCALKKEITSFEISRIRID